MMRLEDWMLVDGDVSVILTRSEFTVIGVLAYGRVTSTDFLIQTMYADRETSDPDSVLKVMICRMREKFRRAGLGKIIVCVWGRGYTLSRPMEIVRRAAVEIVIPAEHRATLERLLYSHPDHVAADRVLAAFVGG